MKKIFYYTTTAIIISCGITQAQTCVPIPTCSSLGYTSSSACDGGIKCPFGEAWYCPSGGQDVSALCSEMGYNYACTGANESGGSGASCGGKYKSCTCASGYNWSNSKCTINSCYGYSELAYCDENSIDYNDMCQSGSTKLYKCSACKSDAQMCPRGNCISLYGAMCVLPEV